MLSFVYGISRSKRILLAPRLQRLGNNRATETRTERKGQPTSSRGQGPEKAGIRTRNLFAKPCADWLRRARRGLAAVTSKLVLGLRLVSSRAQEAYIISYLAIIYTFRVCSKSEKGRTLQISNASGSTAPSRSDLGRGFLSRQLK